MLGKTSGAQVLVTCFSTTLDKGLIPRHRSPPQPTPGVQEQHPGLGPGHRASVLVASPPQSGPLYASSVGTVNLLHPSRQGLPLLVRPQGWALIFRLHQRPTSRQIGSHGPRQPQRRGGTEQRGLVKGSDRLPDKKVPGQARPPDSWGPALGCAHTQPAARPWPLPRP